MAHTVFTSHTHIHANTYIPTHPFIYVHITVTFPSSHAHAHTHTRTHTQPHSLHTEGYLKTIDTIANIGVGTHFRHGGRATPYKHWFYNIAWVGKGAQVK